MQKLIYIFLSIILLFFSCKTQKSSIEYKDVIKVDTFIRTQTNTIYEPINDTLYLPSICDSLIPFYYSKSIPNGRAIISKIGNNLRFTINTKKNNQSTLIQKQKSFKNYNLIKEKIVIKYHTSFWMIMIIFIESVLILLFCYFRFINLIK
jgi:hypothetical protein